jgi:transcriptional regulator with XRE-family HTH domain
VKDLLLLLGKRIHELRVAKQWSQEEFAHVSGLHRTYIGQIERGEKNISFGNLVKVAAVLGVTPAELLLALESGRGSNLELKRMPSSSRKDVKSDRQGYEIEKVLRRFKHQRMAMDRTMTTLEDLMVTGSTVASSSAPRSKKRRSAKS